MSFESDHIAFQKIKNILVVPIPRILNLSTIEAIETSLLARLNEGEVRGVILDFRDVKVIDRTLLEGFKGIVKATQLMGVPTVISSLSHSLVSGLTALKITIDWCPTVSDIDEGMQILV